jgi:GLPGLI family protein
MKYFFIFLFSNLIFSQKADGYIDYQYIHKVDLVDKAKIRKAQFRIFFTPSKTFAYDLNKYNRSLEIAKQLGDQNPEFKNEKNQIKPNDFIIIDLQKQIYNSFEYKNSSYLVKDTVLQDWTILEDKKLVLNYSCQKAITTFRGRDYEAWFTSDIPVPFGPWKFNGLPGAILSVVDKTGDVEFSAIKINTAQVDNIIEEPLYYEEVTKEKLAEINDNYTSQINTNFTVTKNGEQYAPVPKIKKKINNPIELQ